ncbi:DUF1254 domain-containing protein [Prescottella agglutinans]|uniref:DUF1254 domain-containing protein n=1 Tax=Prescottella agglutinans TaxID=1644129 RepID=A0A438B9F9_9NOCA|nr:DUF1254 domain-containing protein [Prescottella agglutinans]RVW07616.1 DUF1254 domain-containing protein [Prescottella agglutinans]
MTLRDSEARNDAPYDFDDGYPTPEAADLARYDADFQRAVTAYRFWYPTVSMEGIFNGNREIGIADNEAVGIASTGPLQVGFTLNSDTPYGAAALDLTDGPMVIELPAGPYIGLVDDHHQRWVMDMGIPGPDEGKGGRHLVLPPGYDGDIPSGYHVGRSNSFTVLLAIRALPVGGDIDRALNALREMKVHRLGAAASDVLKFVDITDKPLDSTCLRWEDNLQFWEVLHGILDREPVVEEFRPMHGLLATLGIRRGEPFAPDPRTAWILERAARVGRDQMLVSAFSGTRPDRVAWPDRAWEWAGLVPDNADFETPAGLDLEARDRWFAQAIVASPAMFRRQVGGGSLYWLAARDVSGEYLDGGVDYTLTIPQPVPAGLFWSLTVYDAQTRSQVQADQGRAALRSMFEVPHDGSDTVTLYVGPNAPAGAENRWVQTVPGRSWFVYLRIYGPQESAFDGTWRPGDFVRR